MNDKQLSKTRVCYRVHSCGILDDLTSYPHILKSSCSCSRLCSQPEASRGRYGYIYNSELLLVLESNLVWRGPKGETTEVQREIITGEVGWAYPLGSGRLTSLVVSFPSRSTLPAGFGFLRNSCVGSGSGNFFLLIRFSPDLTLPPGRLYLAQTGAHVRFLDSKSGSRLLLLAIMRTS